MAWAKSSAAGLGMLAFYFATLSLLGGGLSFAWRQFSQFWWLVLPIVGTFSAQVYLSTKTPVLMGAGSAVSMVACCAHHAAEFLPFLGLFTAASFLIRYQVQFMFLALVLNVFGVFYLWRQKA